MSALVRRWEPSERKPAPDLVFAEPRGTHPSFGKAAFPGPWILRKAFFFGHLYLTATGETHFFDIKAMINGWRELEEKR